MAEEVKKITSTGRIQRPAYNVVAEWVKSAWEAIDIKLIQRSFKCCGISVAMDGSEEGLIYDYDNVGAMKHKPTNYVYDVDTDNDLGEGSSSAVQYEELLNEGEFLEPYVEIEQLDEFESYYTTQEASDFANQWM